MTKSKLKYIKRMEKNSYIPVKRTFKTLIKLAVNSVLHGNNLILPIIYYAQSIQKYKIQLLSTSFGHLYFIYANIADSF